jgi:hypothetical protein
MYAVARLPRIALNPRAMTAIYPNGAANGGSASNGSKGVHTVTALGRWSVLTKQLPRT